MLDDDIFDIKPAEKRVLVDEILLLGVLKKGFLLRMSPVDCSFSYFIEKALFQNFQEEGVDLKMIEGDSFGNVISNHSAVTQTQIYELTLTEIAQ